MDAQHWDERYRSQERLFSGNPNGVLVTEAADLAPGRGLDVGCGEGADALWLAGRGWRVTAVDISQIALDRGVAAAAAAGGDLARRVTWQQTDVTTTPPPGGPFDLVSLQYFPLPVQPDHSALRRLLDVVAPGGTLLAGGHDMSDHPTYRHPDFDPADYYTPDDIAQLLDEDWTVQVNESRLRTTAPPEGTHHVHDTVLRARRLR